MTSDDELQELKTRVADVFGGQALVFAYVETVLVAHSERLKRGDRTVNEEADNALLKAELRRMLAELPHRKIQYFDA